MPVWPLELIFFFIDNWIDFQGAMMKPFNIFFLFFSKFKGGRTDISSIIYSVKTWFVFESTPRLFSICSNFLIFQSSKSLWWWRPYFNLSSQHLSNYKPKVCISEICPILIPCVLYLYHSTSLPLDWLVGLGRLKVWTPHHNHTC